MPTTPSPYPFPLGNFLNTPLHDAESHLSVPAQSVHGVLVDIGCGAGSTMRRWRELGYRTVGLDRSEASVRIAQEESSGSQYVVANAEQLPFADGTVDVVMTISVFQYLDWLALVTECHRVLRPGGRGVFVENLRHNPLVATYRALSLMARRFPHGFLYPISLEAIPKRHITWADRCLIATRFADTRFTAYHVLTPAVFALYILSRDHSPSALAVTQRLYARLEVVDEWLLEQAPAFAHISWLMVAKVVKEQ
jgi:SAM-dependent methyltransferase